MSREWRWAPGQTVLPGSTAAGAAATGSTAAAALTYGVTGPAVPSAPEAAFVPALTAPDSEPAPSDAPAAVPSPRAPLPAAVPGSPLARWISYFDAVEQAALAVAERIAEGHSPTWPDLVVPAPTLPASMVARRDEVLALVDDVTARAERRRDVIAAELSGLAPHAPRQERPAGLGATLDVVG